MMKTMKIFSFSYHVRDVKPMPEKTILYRFNTDLQVAASINSADLMRFQRCYELDQLNASL
jgi:hypothetical protein